MSTTVYSGGIQTAGAVVNSGTGTNWVNTGASLITDCATSDDVRADASLAGLAGSKNLDGQSHSFALKARAIPTGVIVSFEKSADAANAIADDVVRVLGAGVQSDDKADTVTRWGAADATVTYGSPNDLWGLDGELSVDEINGAVFGWRIKAKNLDVAAKHAYIDYATIEPWYAFPQLVTTSTTRSGRYFVLDVDFRADGNGSIRLPLVGNIAPAQRSAIDHVIVLASGTEVPSDNWDITLIEPRGIDLLGSACLNMDLAEDSTYRPYDSTAGSFTFEPSVTREPTELRVDNAGEDGGGRIVVFFKAIQWT